MSAELRALARQVVHYLPAWKLEADDEPPGWYVNLTHTQRPGAGFSLQFTRDSRIQVTPSFPRDCHGQYVLPAGSGELATITVARSRGAVALATEINTRWAMLYWPLYDKAVAYCADILERHERQTAAEIAICNALDEPLPDPARQLHVFSLYERERGLYIRVETNRGGTSARTEIDVPLERAADLVRAVRAWYDMDRPTPEEA